MQDDAAAWSRALFGTAHMLGVADAIARGPKVFRARDVEVATNVAPSTVHRLLDRLVQTRLLVRVPRGPEERHQRFERVRHTFWTATKDLYQQTQLSGEGR